MASDSGGSLLDKGKSLLGSIPGLDFGGVGGGVSGPSTTRNMGNDSFSSVKGDFNYKSGGGFFKKDKTTQNMLIGGVLILSAIYLLKRKK